MTPYWDHATQGCITPIPRNSIIYTNIPPSPGLMADHSWHPENRPRDPNYTPAPGLPMTKLEARCIPSAVLLVRARWKAQRRDPLVFSSSTYFQIKSSGSTTRPWATAREHFHFDFRLFFRKPLLLLTSGCPFSFSWSFFLGEVLGCWCEQPKTDDVPV